MDCIQRAIAAKPPLSISIAISKDQSVVILAFRNELSVKALLDIGG